MNVVDMRVSLFAAFSCVGGCRADDEAEVAWGRCGCPEVPGVSPGHTPACLVPGVSWVVQAEVQPCPLPGGVISLSLHAGSSVCFPFPGGINRKDCFPKPLISSLLYLLLLTCIESVLLVQKMRMLLKGKNALSKEGEEDILVLGRYSVLPLILTLGWGAVKPSGCLVGGASVQKQLALGLGMAPGRQQILLHRGSVAFCTIYFGVFNIHIFKVVPKIPDLHSL